MAVLAALGSGVARAQTDATSFGTLYSFSYTDGGSPEAPPVQATNGNLYGTTWGGGANGYGTVFEIAPAGTLTTLYDFCSQPGCTDGKNPTSGLLQATNGDLYGTTSGGGIADPMCQNASCGTIFKITPNGTLKTLYKFCSQSACADGQYPIAGLVQGDNGDLYGTTAEGGTGTITGLTQGGGTIFKITPSGTLTTIYNFCSQSGCMDGAYPTAGLVQAKNGGIYGTTYLGGPRGDGTIFKMTPSGTPTTLYSFCAQSGCTDGSYPVAALVQATNGDLYGTTYNGGANTNANAPQGGGTIFKITPAGAFNTVYSFCSQTGCSDGQQPQAGLVQASDGSLYGTTVYGGANTNPMVPSGGGTIFKIGPSGRLATLYSFCAQIDCPDGFSPFAGLVQDTVGNLYGATIGGGNLNNRGTIFSLSTGAPAFVEIRPAIGFIGELVTIVGSGLQGASVTFNGTPARILDSTPTVIYTLVPAGATTGKIDVDTSTGALKSNVAFEVFP